MSVFSNMKVAEPEPDGVVVLQRTLRARNARVNANASYARDLEIALHRLNDFTNGADCLTPEELQRVTKLLYPHSEYVPESRMLRSANRAPPTPLGVVPPAWVHPNPTVAKAIADYQAALKAARPPQPVRAEPMGPAGPSRSTRPGWVE